MTGEPTLSLEQYIKKISDIADLDELADAFIEMTSARSVNAVVGHTLPFGASPIKGIWAPIIATFPEEIREFYVKHKCADEDPLMETALAAGVPIQFSQHWKTFDWTPIQKKVFAKMNECGLRDAVAMPVFAKPGVAAYFALTFADKNVSLSTSEIQAFHVICQQYFYRYRQLTDESIIMILTPRERQVMLGIINGKSNVVMAARLGISEHTVDTYVRRCFEKMDASNRVEAAMKCMGNGRIVEQLLIDAQILGASVSKTDPAPRLPS